MNSICLRRKPTGGGDGGIHGLPRSHILSTTGGAAVAGASGGEVLRRGLVGLFLLRPGDEAPAASCQLQGLRCRGQAQVQRSPESPLDQTQVRGARQPLVIHATSFSLSLSIFQFLSGGPGVWSNQSIIIGEDISRFVRVITGEDGATARGSVQLGWTISVDRRPGSTDDNIVDAISTPR